MEELTLIQYENDCYGHPKHKYLYAGIAPNFFTRKWVGYILYKDLIAFIEMNSDKVSLEEFPVIANFTIDYMKVNNLGNLLHSEPSWLTSITDVVNYAKEKLINYVPNT